MELKPISEPTQNGLNFELIRPFLYPLEALPSLYKGFQKLKIRWLF